MRPRAWQWTIGVTALVLGAAGCGDDAAERPVPTAEQLAAYLIGVGDLEGEWSLDLPPDAPDAAASGVVPDDQRDLLPALELCDAASAEAQAVANGVRWMTFRQLDLAVDDPIDPPDDRTGHLVVFQELLTAGEPAELETTFELLRAGMEACLGEIPAGEEGPGRAEAMALPDVGDDRSGVLTTVEEAGGWAEWRLHSALVRDGDVLASIVVTDIRAGDDTAPFFTIDEVGAMVSAAVERL